MEDMIRHAQAVRRGTPNAWLIGDMPYMSYQPVGRDRPSATPGASWPRPAATRIKLEGGVEMADRMAGIVAAGIPAMGHLGLTPQSVSALGGFRVQGKGAQQAKKIVDDAKALEEAGAFAILLEMVPDRVCQLITERAENCLIISLGSGPHAHGQLLIYHDMFGLYPRFKPRMAKVFGEAGKVDPGRAEAVRRRSDVAAPIPAARELVRHAGRRVPRSCSTCSAKDDGPAEDRVASRSCPERILATLSTWPDPASSA